MKVSKTVAEARAVRATLPGRLGLVPTMGALHDGHLELVRRARRENEAVAVSIFVNPLQFNSADDLTHYPRDLDRDLRLLAAEGVDLVFTPEPDQVYPAGFSTSVDAGPVARPFEGAYRPGHFTGVATVVTILFNIVQPDRAYFGQKDAQQLLVVRRLVDDLRLPVEIVPVPTVRDRDGLALSSRNALLSPEQRELARGIPRALMAVHQRWGSGIRDAGTLQAELAQRLESIPDAAVEYAAIADPETLDELEGEITGPALALIAVRIGQVRLIDNWLLLAAEECEDMAVGDGALGNEQDREDKRQ